MEGDARSLCCLSLLLFLFTSPHNALHSPDLVLGGVGIFNSPSVVAVDPNSDALFVVDTNNNRVLRFDSRSSLTSGSPPDFVYGNNANMTSGGSLNQPFSACVDFAGNLWIADSGNSRVLLFSGTDQNEPPVAVLWFGQASLNASLPNKGFGSPTANTMSNPRGVTIDSTGTLWVSDSGNNRFLPPFPLYVRFILLPPSPQGTCLRFCTGAAC